jgi:hypothetical protein
LKSKTSSTRVSSFPGVVMDLTGAKSSEHNLRNFYKRWSEFMGANSWEELATWRNGK